MIGQPSWSTRILKLSKEQLVKQVSTIYILKISYFLKYIFKAKFVNQNNLKNFKSTVG